MTRNATKHLEFKFALQYIELSKDSGDPTTDKDQFLFPNYAKGVIIFSIKADEKWLEVHVVKNSVSVSRHLKEIQVD